MKFLYSHRTKSADGQYVHIRELTDALSREGHRIMMSGPEGSFLKEGEAARGLSAGISGKRMFNNRLPDFAYEMAECGYSIPAYRRISAAAKDFAPDVIYERFNLFYLSGLWLKRKTGLPLILEVNAPLRKERAAHGGLALPRLAEWSERKVWQAADAVLPVTQVLAEDLIAAGVDEQKITVIPNGVTADWLAEIDPMPIIEQYGLQGKFVFGFTGFVRDWHGVDRILDYIKSSGNKRLHLLLVGDGPAVPDLKAQAKALGIGDQFTVTGVVQREEVPGFVAAFDIALQPRVTDYASPLKLMEYMALSRPIIGPDMANIREVLTHDKNALLFAPGDHAAMSEALDRLVHDEALCARLGAEARRTVIDRDMTWDGNARRVVRIAQDLIGRRA